MYSLTEQQLAILQAIWERGEATVAQVQDDLDRDVALSTVATLLGRLEKRGLLTHRTEGRQYVYRALVAEAQVRRSMTVEFADLTEDLFRGDVTAMVSQLLTAREVDGADLERLRALIDKKAADLEAPGHDEGNHA